MGHVVLNNIKFNGNPVECIPPILPTEGALSCSVLINDEKSPRTLVTDDGLTRLILFIQTSFATDNAKVASVLMRLSSFFNFTKLQAQEILTLLDPKCASHRFDRAEVAVALLLHLSDLYSDENKEIEKEDRSGPKRFFEDKDNDGKIDVCGDICTLAGLDELNDVSILN